MKVKEHIQKTQEKENELDLSFAEWMDYFSKEPTTKELNDMEKQHKLHPINNPNYNCKTGA